MIRFYLALTVLTTAICAQAQTGTDTIEMRKTIGTVFLLNELELSPKDLIQVIRPNPEAYKKMKIAKLSNTLSTITGIAGGGMLGWSLGSSMMKGETNWLLTGIGAGLMGISIGFSIGYNIYTKKAVRIYNDGLLQSGFHNRNIRFGITGNGFTLKYQF
jgi:hypothetical protein